MNYKKILAAALALTLTAGAVALPLGENGGLLGNVGISASAADEISADEQFKYEQVGEVAYIKKFNKDMVENIEIPDHITTRNGQSIPVVKLCNYLFKNRDNVLYCKTIKIPKSIEIIDNSAFESYNYGWNDSIIYKVMPGSKAHEYIKDKGWTFDFYGETSMDDKDIKVNNLNSEYMYTGEQITPKVTVVCGSYTLIQNSDYTTEYENNINEGTAKIKITGKGFFKGTIEKEFKIKRLSLNSEEAGLKVSGLEDVYGYTGSEIKPEFTLTLPGATEDDKDVTLEKGKDYDVSYESNIEEGVAKVTITGKGSYSGTVTKTFKIVKHDIKTDGSVEIDNTNYDYTGSAIEPGVKVYYDGDELKKDTDYKVTYSNNVNEGTATVTVQGTGMYSGTVEKQFNINKKSISDCSFSSVDSTYYYTGSAIKPSISVQDGWDYLTAGDDYTVSYSNNVKEGTAAITITGKGYYKGTKKITFRITKVSLSSASISNVNSTYYVSKTPNVKPRPSVYAGGRTLVNGKDYTLSYRNSNKIGTAAVVITGKGKCKGTRVVRYKIRPAQQKVTGTKALHKAIKVAYKKNTAATGYQIHASGYNAKTKVVNVYNKNKTSAVIKGLKKNQGYYVKVRSFTKVNGIKVYGDWSYTRYVYTK